MGPEIAAMGECQASPDAGQLCLQCGLCCDGTLFGRVPLAADDDMEHLATWAVRQGAKREHLPLPCAALQDRACIIYPHRPARCKEYRCRLLERYEKGEISFAEAAKVVVQTVKHKARVKAAFRAATDGEDVPLRQLYRRMKACASISPDNAPLFLDHAALQLLLDKHFRNSPAFPPCPS